MNSNAVLAMVALLINQGLLDADRVLAAEPLLPAKQAAQIVRFIPIKGRIRIEGTSNVDNWQVESRSIGGFMEVGLDFPIHVGQKASANPSQVNAEVLIDVRSLRSIEKDGKPFSNKMDDIMYHALRAKDHPRISYLLSRLTRRSGSRSSAGSSEFDAQGQVVVAGVTNKISMPVSVLPLEDNQLKLWGTVSIRMTDYQIEPPSPKITLGLIKTGDEVKLSFEWVLARRN